MTARCRHLPTDDAAICRRPSGASLSVATGSGASVSVPTRSGASLSVPTRSGASPSVPTRSGTSHHPGRLVGLVRVVSDGCSVALVQDLLVAPAFQRCGIGRRLLDEAMTRFADLRQVLLITDDEPATRDFYRACGLSTLAETHGLGFIRYNLSA
ncbi:GNAT family N-acetyltransferase [Acidipropionibacterium jensenii]|uniref:GNAT family N-acetyltransferase n=1 Tax=Acidipropionibacterium jensenii TaxID=1749 RepID=UPI00214AB2A5|nr:GNAT family N-acetyltransferase [Acidipropionibacterium jensenii]